MNNLTTLVIATGNSGKTAEIEALLKNFPVKIKNLKDFGPIPHIEEDGDSFDDNAYKKASFASRVLGLPALADDSGLLVEALSGAPGVLSARYVGENATDEELISCQIAMQNNIQHFRKVFQTADLQYRNNESTTKTKLNLVYAFFMICNKLTAANNKLIAKNFEKYPGKIEYLLSIARTLFYSQQSFSGVTTHGMYATTANPTSDPLAPTFANDQTKEAQYNHVQRTTVRLAVVGIQYFSAVPLLFFCF